jgi:streptogramin lyase
MRGEASYSTCEIKRGRRTSVVTRWPVRLVLLVAFAAPAVCSCGPPALGAAPRATPRGLSAAAQEASRTPGSPLVLAPAAGGGVWYGGSEAGASESDERLDYITPAGAILDFPFTGTLEGYSPEYLAPDANGGEWVLADRGPGTAPRLADVSRTGMITLNPVALPSEDEVRGLAMGADGDLWMTETHVEHLARVSAILRVTPTGTATAFTKGLQLGAIPRYITAGRGGTLWFTDEAGRIGRITTGGIIREFPIGHGISAGRPYGPIVADSRGNLWFIADLRGIGRMTPAGQVTIFTPPPPLYLEPEPSNAEGGTFNLAAGPEGDAWFTRSSGEVARIDQRGRVTTVTDRLESADGIAFAGSGSTAWVGEGPSFRYQDGKERPARVARITATGNLTQYPQPPPCRVPLVIGDGPHRAVDEIRSTDCEVLSVSRPPRSRSNHLIVVSQSVRPGALVAYKTPVRLRLGRKPPPPVACRSPRYSRVLHASRDLIVWMDPPEEPDNEDSHGEGEEPYFACVPPRGTKRQIFVEERDLEEYHAQSGLHVAGHFIGIASSGADHYNSGSNDLTVFDIARGTVALDVSYSFSEGQTATTAVGPFAIDARGDVAWVVKVFNGSGSPRETLVLRDTEGQRDVEAGVGISDVAINGHVLSWTSGGERRSQALAPRR